jgi:hypothetical protein
MSIDDSPMTTGQSVQGCPGYTTQTPNQTVETTLQGTGTVDSWSIFDGWDGATMLSGSFLQSGFAYARNGGPGNGGTNPDYITSTDNKTFTGKVTTVSSAKDTNLKLTETSTVTVKFDDFGSELKGSFQYTYERTCEGGAPGMCDNDSVKPITCQSGTATFMGRQVQSDTVNASPG